MALFRRTFAVFLLICLGCSAQSVSPELSHKIEKQVRSFYNLPPRVKVVLGPLQNSEFPNYDAMTITLDGGDKKVNYDFLLSKDRNTLIRQTKLDLSKDPYAETMKKMDLANRPVRGTKNAKVVAVNYDDFECPYCSRMHQTLFPQLLKEYGDRVEFVYKDFPLTEIHPWALHAAVNANCLAAQNTDAYWDFADYMHNNQREINSVKGEPAQFAALDRITADQGQKHSLDSPKLQACMKMQDETAIKASVKEAEGLGVDGTPALFVNGQKVDGGALPIDDLREILDRALVEAGLTPPSHPAGQSSGSGGQ
ncbi:MAG TPA: thioredoxin domain-containing protein [Terriglobales bacterium]|nr:thioredoxin domain-containing protein [Terriglobales bacterium]